VDLYHEVRGSGPALLLIPGSNGDAGFYGALADLLADRCTVISYDRRGFSRSPGRRPPDQGWAEMHAEDARRLLDSFGPARVFGSSAGAVIGFDLISRYPHLVTRLVAHEPPLAEVLPDAERWLAFFRDVTVTHREEGAGPAMRKFMAGIGLDTASRPDPVDAALVGRMPGNVGTILAEEVPNAPSFRPDLVALDAQRDRIVLAAGRDSRGHFPGRPVEALAARWHREVVEFPGDHTGYWSQPVAFAGTLAGCLGLG
jgi:pimeloyl-ACP methyl ester carboxylesterase